LNNAKPDKYIASRCGEINSETQFALSFFGLKPPLYVENVEPKVSDIDIPPLVSAKNDVPTVDVATLMDSHNVKNVPIVNDNEKLVGLISERGLAKVYVRRLRIEPLRVAPIKLETLARVLKAKIIVEGNKFLSGKVYTAVDALHVALSKLSSDDIAIVGDDEPAQLALIDSGIAALIVVDNAPVGKRVEKEAETHKTSVLSTSLDAFGVGKMINLSLPAKMIMAKDVPTLRMEDTLEYARELVYSSKFRSACVIDGNEKLLGVVTRTTLMEDIHKSVILLDHNEYTQAVDGIEKAEILEIIDHHRLGTMSTLKPIKFLNDPLGSTCTIIAIKYMGSNLKPTREVAGALLSGILSDTLVLKLSTTTSIDVKAAEYLSKIAKVNIKKYGTKLVEAGMKFNGLSLEEILTRDTKRYVLFGKNVVISQVMVPSFEYDEEHFEKIRAKIDQLKKAMYVDCFFALFTNVFENASDLFVSGDAVCLKKVGAQKQPVRLKQVMSRKKDFLPKIGDVLRNIH